MYENRNDLGTYSATENTVTAGTTALLALTIVMVALASGLAAYVFARDTLQQLQQQGYQYWMDTSFDSPFFVNFGFFGGSAWTNYQPGQSLSIAFATQPMLRGILGFAGIATGGIILLLSARHLTGVSRKHPGLAFGLFFCLAGIQGAFEPPPDNININLTSHALDDGSTDVALGDVNGFGTYTHTGRHSHGTDLFVQHDGEDTTLARFSFSSDAVTVQSALQNFVSSGGTQL